MKQRGFSLIGLLISLVIVMLLVINRMRTLPGSDGTTESMPGIKHTKTLMLMDVIDFEEDLKHSKSAQFYADRNQIRFTDIEYQFNNGKLIRRKLSTNQTEELLVGLVDLQFDYLSAKDHQSLFTPIDLAKYKTVGTIVAKGYVADTKEKPDFYLNDKLHGIDLDGDPGNGCAPIQEISFLTVIGN